MFNFYNVILILIFTIIISMVFTEIVRIIAFKIGAVDKPNSRRINTKTMPSSGGLAIYLSYFLVVFLLLPIKHSLIIPIFIGATIIIITGVIDDIKEISARYKILGIVLATLVIYFLGDIGISRIDIPFYKVLELGYFSLPITLIWVAAITNSVNLIDGLDGLASGISAISLTTIGIIAYSFLNVDNISISVMIFILVAAILGFLPANYFPAKIYLGDSGALFLGFMISTFSLLGLKNATFLSLIVPIVILGIPIADTAYAIIRRVINKQPVSMADNKHIHHRLMAIGFNHKQTVKLMYTISIVFSFVALLFPIANNFWSFILTLSILLMLHMLAEIIGLIGEVNTSLTEKLRKILSFLNKDYNDF